MKKLVICLFTLVTIISLGIYFLFPKTDEFIFCDPVSVDKEYVMSLGDKFYTYSLINAEPVFDSQIVRLTGKIEESFNYDSKINITTYYFEVVGKGTTRVEIGKNITHFTINAW